MNIGILEENKVLRKWYEENGFIHIGTKKFVFFIHMRIYGNGFINLLTVNRVWNWLCFYGAPMSVKNRK